MPEGWMIVADGAGACVLREYPLKVMRPCY